MRTIGQFRFPDWNLEDAARWQPVYRRRMIALKVMCVAKTRIEGAWNAYVAAVPGKDHEVEWEDVWQHGEKLEAKVAAALFPEFDGIPYAR